MRDVRRTARRCTRLLGMIALVGACLPPAAPALTEQKIKFTSKPPNPAFVGAPTYTVEATGGGSGNPVTFTIDPASSSVCTISGSTVSFIGGGTCTINANQAGNTEFAAAPQAQQSFAVSRKAQEINFTSPAPEAALVGGPTYTVQATGGESGNPVIFTIDPASSSVCTISGSTVSFIGGGTCTIDANQEGDEEFAAAPQTQQSFAVGPTSQSIQFTSATPQAAIVGGPPYTVTANASSGLPVSLTVDPSASSVCAMSGSSVSFIGVGTCTINANQLGNASYLAAQQVQQSFSVGPAITITPQPPPKTPPSPSPGSSHTATTSPGSSPTATTANFKAISATLHSPSFTITLKEQVSNAGTLSWVLTFPNGRFGVFGAVAKAHKGKCKAGFMRLSGKCRPKRVTYGRGSMSFAAAGLVTITVKPSAAAKQALKTALRKKQNMRITAVLTFRPRNGGTAVTHTQLLTVKLSSAK